MINLKVTSYDGKILEIGNVEEVYFTAKDSGDICILSNHLPIASLLDVSIFSYRKDNQKVEFVTTGGLLYFANNKCELFLETFDEKNNVNIEEIQKRKIELEKKLETISSKDSQFESLENQLKKTINVLKYLN